MKLLFIKFLVVDLYKYLDGNICPIHYGEELGFRCLRNNTYTRMVALLPRGYCRRTMSSKSSMHLGKVSDRGYVF